MVFCGAVGHLAHSGVSDTSPRKTDDAHERFVVTRIDRQAEIADSVFDFLALVERRAAVDAVGNTAFAQFALKRARLRIGAVENGYIVVVHVAAAMIVLHGFSYTDCLVAVGHVGLKRQRLSLFVLGINLLADLLLVLLYERIGRIDDVLRRAVVALQFEEPRTAVGLLKIEDIAYVRTAEGVYRLRVIADDGDIVLRRSQLFDQQVLHVVGVLILIHKDVAERLLVFLPDLGERTQQEQRFQQQVVKIHGVALFES